MTKEELAQQYADEKAAEMTELLKAAYMKGYEQGELKVACSISIEGLEYYDLGLSSGTLWSKPLRLSGYRMIPYQEAARFEGLPTEEQWNELIKECKVLSEATIIGRTGERIRIEIKDYAYHGEALSETTNAFWLKSETNEKGEAKIGVIHKNGMDTSTHFTGYKLPIMLTKKKEDI